MDVFGMPANLIALGIACLTLAGFMFCEKVGNRRLALPFKTATSLLFVAVALLSDHPNPSYFYFLLGGLALCVVGDVFLALPQQKAFLLGLVAFLLGHVAYALAFVSLASLNQWALWGLLLAAVLSGSVYAWLYRHLGDMRIPVLAYVLVITFMVATACAVFGESSLPSPGRLFVLVGAVSFYLSDICVARDRFVSPGFVNRLFGLPLYYGGQFVLAFSVGLVG